MAFESSSQQTLRKAIGAIKDSTSVGMAKVNSEYKEIKVSVLKATNHVEFLPKEKHVRTILGAVSGSKPRSDVAYCIHTLTKRLAKTHSWVVALKTLIVIHRALREVDHSFCEELIHYNQHRGHFLNLLHFKDDSSPNAWDYSTWIRTYALYIEECLECFHVLKYDFYRDHTRTKKFDTPALLKQLPALQQLLFRLLCCEPVGAARYNFMIQYALSIVAAESVRLYVAITDGVLLLVDKFFEMQRRDAVRALEIYRKAGEQAQRLSEFFEMCRSLEFGRRQKYVNIEQPPASFLGAMEEYIKDAPEHLMLPWTANNDECVTPKLVAAAEANLETDDSQIKPEKSGTDEIPDLLSWEEPSQEVSESDEKNSTPEELSNSEIGSGSSSEPASWELALVTTASSDPASAALTKDGVVNRSVLDSLYDAALTKTDTNGAHQTSNASSNPFEADDYAYNQNMFYNAYDQNMFYNPSLVAHASFMQMAAAHQEQAAFMQHRDHPEQPMVCYNYMQIAGVPQHHQQQESSIVGHDSMQMNEIPQIEAPIQQQNQQEISAVVGNDSINNSGNPFVEQSSTPVVSQNQSSDFSLL